jgi:tetratricopeptide (TPR) repeat protein
LVKALEYLEDTAVNEGSLHWLGLTYYGLGLYEKALSCCAELVKRTNDPFYWKIMGSAHLKLGNYFEAKMLFEKALAENPQDEELEKLLTITGHYLKAAELPENRHFK